MAGFNKIAVILAMGSAIWFVVGFYDLIETFIQWSQVPEGISREGVGFSGLLFSILDSLFLLGSAAMVEYLSRIWNALRYSKDQ
ncbi:MAG: hypothetical protein ACE5FO_02955 [Parvularculaceae bacterium]